MEKLRNTKAVILVGGEGKRLKSVVKDVPKPMALIAGKPFLEHQLNFLKEQGLEKIILAVGHKGNIIKSYFGDGRRVELDITYSHEKRPLGTAGAVKEAEKYIDDTFFVLNGDSIAKMGLSNFLSFHQNKQGIASIGLTNIEDSSHHGSVVLEGNKIKSFDEKEKIGEGLINCGVYLFEPRIFSLIEKGVNSSLEKEIFPKLIIRRELYGYNYEGYFMDIGRPETYSNFKKDFIGNLSVRGDINVREAMQRIEKAKNDILLITKHNGELEGVVNTKIINRYLIGGGELDNKLFDVMVNPDKVARVEDSEEKIKEIISSGTKRLPILDEKGKVEDVRFSEYEIIEENYPVVRGKSPLRISFAGGGTDLPKFFEKYGGAVINTTIDKYCYATAIKRADSKVIVNSDMSNSEYVTDLRGLEYDGNFDIIKAVTKLMNPKFGFELYLRNDIPPGRGLGSSASFSVLLGKILGKLQGSYYDDEYLAELAYKAETQELGIIGGKQDQYSTVIGGFNWMEFENGDRKIMHPLRIKEETIADLNSHLLLCYVGQSHSSMYQHSQQEKKMEENEEEVVERLNFLKKTAFDIKDALLSANPQLNKIGYLLNESWEKKRSLEKSISNPKIDELYSKGLQNGAYGGKLLGSGGGGYLLFYYEPEQRKELVENLDICGGEILDFNFAPYGAKVWNSGE